MKTKKTKARAVAKKKPTRKALATSKKKPARKPPTYASTVQVILLPPDVEADVANYLRSHGVRPDPFLNSQNILMLQAGESLSEFKIRMLQWHQRQRAMVNATPMEYRPNPISRAEFFIYYFYIVIDMAEPCF